MYDRLREHKAAFCIYELDGHLSPKVTTGDTVYVRLHGPDGKYEGEYGGEGLSGWAGAIHAWRDQGKTVYVYFDNDADAAAVRDARRLREMVG